MVTITISIDDVDSDNIRTETSLSVSGTLSTFQISLAALVQALVEVHVVYGQEPCPEEKKAIDKSLHRHVRETVDDLNALGYRFSADGKTTIS